jgi:serine/threonine protein kinase
LDYPGIVKLFTAFHHTKNVFLVMKYLPGGNLERLINNKILTEPTKRFYFAELVNIIEYLQSKNLTHSDLKVQFIRKSLPI